jgi:SWI/SNF-related matrix-associated actin-dependent regulator of chromatin subfamily A3
MSSLGKRKSEWVDLTGDEENFVPQSKQARGTHSGSSQPQPSQSLSLWGAGAGDEASEHNDVIDLSQDADEGFGWTCLGATKDKIVGIRYYNGYATPGEKVMIRREPQNQYDRNAIRVNNVQGTQIGHLPRNLAAKLAPYMVSHKSNAFPLSLMNRLTRSKGLKVSRSGRCSCWRERAI